MSDLDRLRDMQRSVTLQRRKGEAMERAGRSEEAAAAYAAALSLIGEMLESVTNLGPVPGQGETLATADIASEAAELFGLQGGLLRRQGRLEDALESYKRGAALEAAHSLAPTYNRANAIKLSLMSGKTTVADEQDALAALRDTLEVRLSTDERAADDAWLWADLGDLRLLLGDAESALAAYRTFHAKGRTESPRTTLRVLHQVVSALRSHDDPDASRLDDAVREVEQLLLGR
jgi:tetratricopeptide (TPR) repeat protein